MDVLKLEPCPRCGNAAEFLTDTELYNNPKFTGRRAVFCRRCGIAIFGYTNVDAAEIWNRNVIEVRAALKDGATWKKER